MDIQLPGDTPLPDRLRTFADFLDDRFARLEELLEATPVISDFSYRLKAERGELTAISTAFRRLFEREIQNSE